MIYRFLPTNDANFTVKISKTRNIHEHIGHAKLNRGVFRISLKFPFANMMADEEQIKNTIKQSTLLKTSTSSG